VIDAPTSQTGFYVTGGTVPLTARSYIARRADQELYAGLRQGHFCYVLSSRQMGKSSLMNRVSNRLRDEGGLVAELDLTGIGQNLTVEQWYDGLVYVLGRELGLKRELTACWRSYAHLGPLHRFLTVLREGALALCSGQVFIFVDEIEVVQSLPFSTDEFFASIRECYNRRTSDPDMNRLTFCLVGMSTPLDLIGDTRITPFNIGKRIELRDFGPDEALPLAAGLDRPGTAGADLLRRVLYWTNGHPYLTQRLCQAVADDPSITTPAAVDALCKELFLSRRAREVDVNLAPVKHYLMNACSDRAALLNLYENVRRGRCVADDETNRVVRLLKLSGVVRVVNGCLGMRNRIYGRVFDLAWIRESLPDAEIQRQRAAYMRGLARAVTVASVIIAAMGWLTFRTIRSDQAVQSARDSAQRLLYVQDINLAQHAYDEGDVSLTLELLDELREAGGAQWTSRFEWRYLWASCHRYIRSFNGHHDSIFGAAFLRGGRYLETVSKDKTMTLWDVATGQAVRVMPVRSTPYGIAFSPDGATVAIGYADGVVALSDTMTGTQRRTLYIDHGDAVWSLGFTADGRRLAAGSLHGAVKVWDSASGALLRGFENKQGSCYVALSPDGDTVASSDDTGTVTLWNLRRPGRRTLPAFNDDDQVTALAFSPNGSMLAVGGHDGAIGLWDTAKWTQIQILNGHTRTINSLSFTPDGHTMASTSNDTTVRLWRVPSGEQIGVVRGHTGRAFCAVFAPRLGLLATTSSDMTAKLWDLASVTTTNRLSRLKGLSLLGVISHDCRTVAMESDGGMAAFYAAGSPVPKRRETIPGGSFAPIAFSPDGAQAVFKTPDGRIHFFNTSSWREEFEYQGRACASYALAFSATGDMLAVGDWDLRQNAIFVELWDTRTHRMTALFRSRLKSIYKFAFSGANERLLAVAGSEPVIEIWDTAARRPVHTVAVGLQSISALAFSPDSRLLAVSGIDKSVELWKVPDWTLERSLQAHTTETYCVTFSPDGRTLATAGDDDVKLWDVATGQETLTLDGLTDAALGLAFSTDNASLAAVTRNWTFHLWETVTKIT
jgi:WD40 repeat protein